MQRRPWTPTASRRHPVHAAVLAQRLIWRVRPGSPGRTRRRPGLPWLHPKRRRRQTPGTMRSLPETSEPCRLPETVCAPVQREGGPNAERRCRTVACNACGVGRPAAYARRFSTNCETRFRTGKIASGDRFGSSASSGCRLSANRKVPADKNWLETQSGETPFRDGCTTGVTSGRSEQ